jgi:FkbM family methyltransferase
MPGPLEFGRRLAWRVLHRLLPPRQINELVVSSLPEDLTQNATFLIQDALRSPDNFRIGTDAAPSILLNDQRYLRIPVRAYSRAQLLRTIERLFAKTRIDQVIAIPRTIDDLRLANAIADLHQARYAVYFNNATGFLQQAEQRIVIQEALRKANLCCAATLADQVSLEKHGARRVSLLPPLVPWIESAEPKSVSFGPPYRVLLAGSFADQKLAATVTERLRAEGIAIVAALDSRPTPSQKEAGETTPAGSTLNQAFSKDFLASLETANLVLLLPQSNDGSVTSDELIFSQLSLAVRLAILRPVPQIVAGKSLLADFVTDLGLGFCWNFNVEKLETKIQQARAFAGEQLARRVSTLRNGMNVWEGRSWLRASLAADRPIDERFEELVYGDSLLTLFLPQRTVRLRKAVGRPDVIVSSFAFDPPSKELIALIDALQGSDSILLSAEASVAGAALNDHSFRVGTAGLAENELAARVSEIFAEAEIATVFAIPKDQEDLRLALALARLQRRPLAVYFLTLEAARMDSSESRNILLDVSQSANFCCAGTESIRSLLQKHYGRRIWLLPPAIGPAKSLQSEPASSASTKPIAAVVTTAPDPDLVSKINRVFQKEALDVSALVLGERNCSPEMLAQLPPSSLLILADEVPANNEFFAQALCLQIATRSAVRQIVVSSGELGAFAKIIGLGARIGRDQVADRIRPLQSANDQVGFSEERRRLLADELSASSAAQWLRDAVPGAAVHPRYEKLFGDSVDRLTPFVDADPPPAVHWEFVPQLQALERLKLGGYDPDFIVDIGASTGVWSHYATKVYPTARYYLIEPLLQTYLAREPGTLRLHPEFRALECAAGAKQGIETFKISQDLYGSSFFDDESSAEGRSFTTIDVTVRNLDEIALSEKIAGRGLLKIDTQFSEHLVIEGATNFLAQVDVIIVELSLQRFSAEAKTFSEMVFLLQERGFVYHDVAGSWRDAVTGRLLQQDAVFARHDLFDRKEIKHGEHREHGEGEEKD